MDTPGEYQPIEIRQLSGLPETSLRSICEWINDVGYPWLLWSAFDPEQLTSEDHRAAIFGVYIDPVTGDVVIRTPEVEQRVKYQNWIVLWPKGRFTTCGPDQLAEHLASESQKGDEIKEQ